MKETTRKTAKVERGGQEKGGGSEKREINGWKDGGEVSPY